MKSSSLVRSSVLKLHAYAPGEQPKIKGLIKLNTNENPYPPSPRVLQAVRRAVDGRLRLYPNPSAQPLREALARLHGCGPENFTIGNGSDELLALATRAFVEPAAVSRKAAPSSRSVVQYFTPSYSLYPVLVDIHGALRNPVPLAPDFTIPSLATLKRGKQWDFRAALTFVTTPNAPSGRGYSTAQLAGLCRAQKGVVILDEAYVDFADGDAMSLATKLPNVLVARTFSKAYSLCFQRIGYFVGHPELIAALDKIRDSYNVNGLGQIAAVATKLPNVLVARTFSKAYSLCFQRIGYFVGHPELIAALDKIRDSYNVNGLGQVAAVATLRDLAYYRRNFERVKATRQWLLSELAKLGFETSPSQTNFILTRPPGPPAQEWLELLRQRKVLVRWFGYPELSDKLRITIGTPEEAQAFAAAARRILAA